MTAYTVGEPCWVVDLPGDDDVSAHLSSLTEAAAEAHAYTASREIPLPGVRRLPHMCASAVCDECGDDYRDPATGWPVHFASTEAAMRAVDAAGWTADETCTVLHCDECSQQAPLPASPLSAWRFPAVVDVPLPGLEQL